MQWVSVAHQRPDDALGWRGRVKCEGYGKVYARLDEERLKWFGECPRSVGTVTLSKVELEAIVTREG